MVTLNETEQAIVGERGDITLTDAELAEYQEELALADAEFPDESSLEQEEAEAAEITESVNTLQKDSPTLSQTEDDLLINQQIKNNEAADTEEEVTSDAQVYVADFYKNVEEYQLLSTFEEGYTDVEYVNPDNLALDNPGLTDLIVAQARQNNALLNSIESMSRYFDTHAYEVDDSFDAVQAARGYTSGTGDYESFEFLADSNNQSEFQAKLERVKRDDEDFATMARFGTGTNLVTGFLSSAIDVDALVPWLAVNKVAKTSKAVSRLEHTLQNVKTGAQAGAAANLTTGVVLANTTPEYTKGDVVADMFLGTLLGGFIGHVTSGNFRDTDVKVHEDGSIEIPGIDELHKDVKDYVDSVEGQTVHSKTEYAPTSAEDAVLRAKNNIALKTSRINSGIDPTILKDFATLGIDGVKKLSKSARKTLKNVDEGTLNFAAPKATLDNATEYVQSVKRGFGEYDTVVTQNRLKASDEGTITFRESITTAATPGRADADVAVPTRDQANVPRQADQVDTGDTVVGLDAATITNINKTLRAVHGKGHLQVEDIQYKGDDPQSVTIKYPDGRTKTYTNKKGTADDPNQFDARYMEKVIRSNMLVDTSASLNNISDDVLNAAQKNFDNELRNVRDFGTDFAQAMKQNDSYALKDVMLKMASSATGNNTLTGTNGATIKNGVRVNNQQHLGIYETAAQGRAQEIMTEKKVKPWLKFANKVFAVDQRPYNMAYREMSDLVSDLNLQKKPEHVALADDLRNLMAKWVDRNALHSNSEFLQEVDALSKKHKQNKFKVRGVVGSTMSAWRSLDNMKAPPVEDVNAGSVKGTEHLERSFYQPQKPSGSIVQDFKNAGYSQSEITKVFYEGYYQGIKLKNPDMDIDDVEGMAEVISTSIVGRYWDARVFKSNDAKEFTQFTEELTNYIRTNNKLADDVKEDLYDLKRGLEADAATAGFLKGVTPFDRTAEVKIFNELTGKTETIQTGYLMQSNDANSWIQYTNRAAGETALASKGIRDRSDLSQIRRIIEEELQATGKYDGDEISSRLDVYDSVMATIMSVPNPVAQRYKGATEKITQVKRALNLAVLNKLALAQIGETAAVLQGVGTKRGFDYITGGGVNTMSRAQLKKNYKQVENLGLHWSVIEHFNSPQMDLVEELGIASSKEKVSRVLDVGERIQRRAFLMNNLMSWQSKTSWLTSMEELATHINKNGTVVTKELANAGVDTDLLNIIKREMDNGRLEINEYGLNLNYDNVDFGEIMPKQDFIKLQGVIQSIQNNKKLLRPDAGLSYNQLNNPIVNALATLKTYPLHAFNTILLRSYQHMDKSKLAFLASATAFSMFATYLKAIIETKDPTDVKIAEAMLKYNSLTGLPGQSAAEFIGSTFNIDALKPSYSYGRNNTFSVPTLDYLNNVVQLPRALMHLGPGEFTPADMNVINGTLGMVTQNIFTAGLFNQIKQVQKDEAAEQRRERRQQRRAEQRAQEQQETQTQESQAVETLSNL